MRIGLIGCGEAGRKHLMAYKQLNMEVAVYDSDLQTVSDMKKKYSVIYKSLEELIQWCEVIDIATPTDTHLEIVEKVVKYKKDIIMETPLARTMEEMIKLNQLCESYLVKLYPVILHNYDPLLIKIKDVLKVKGCIGIARITRTNQGIPKSFNGWREEFAKSGGVILERLYHDIAYLIELFGPIERIFANKTSTDDLRDAEEYALVSIGFSNGSIAHLNGCWMKVQQNGDEMEYAYPGGLISYSDLRNSPIRTYTKTKKEMHSPLNTLPITSFLSKTLAYGSSELNIALEAMRISLAALESCTSGQPVRLDKGGMKIC